MAQNHSPLSFWKLWTASALSNLSDGVGVVVMPLLAADPTQVAGLFFANRVSWLIFPLLSGALVDRLDRRRTMAISNVLRAGLLGVLGLTVLMGWSSLWLLYIVAFLLGMIETFYDNAAQAILPTIVTKAHLTQANARIQSIELINNQFIGPTLSDFLFAIAMALPFLLNGAAFAITVLFILALPGSFRPSHTQPLQPRTLLNEIGEGIVWLWDHHLIRSLAILLCLSNMMGAATGAILVLFAQDVLGLNEVGFGLLTAATAIGGVFGSFVASQITQRLGPKQALVGSLLGMAIAPLIIALTTNVFLVGTMYALIGFAAVIWNVITISLRQSIVPEELFGRVNSVYRLLGLGGTAVGALIGGWLAQLFGLTAPFWVAAGVTTLLALVALRIISVQQIKQAQELSSPS
ncbi:MAG: MFS transporter [Chloroflexota bacterium]